MCVCVCVVRAHSFMVSDATLVTSNAVKISNIYQNYYGVLFVHDLRLKFDKESAKHILRCVTCSRISHKLSELFVECTLNREIIFECVMTLWGDVGWDGMNGWCWGVDRRGREYGFGYNRNPFDIIIISQYGYLICCGSESSIFIFFY